jgi:RNA polymerase sigma-70 factor (sigma-E family)
MIMRTRKTKSGRRPLGVRTWRAAEIPDQIPAARAERDSDQETPTGRDADHAVITLYQEHYRSLVRLAALLVSDLATAEGIVEESFAAVHDTWHALPDTDAALCYLRRSVVRQARSAPRRQPGRSMRAPGPPGGSAEAILPLQNCAVVSAMRVLPIRQREVMVLRYFADLSEAEVASAIGKSTAAVRSHAARAMSSLRAELLSAYPAEG